MSDVTVTRDSSPLDRETWRYWFDERARALTLDSYTHQTRSTKRHRNWTTVEGWARLSHYRVIGALKNPPTRKDVDAEALAIFRASISVLQVPLVKL